MHILQNITRIAAALAGFILLYTAFFLYEDQEGKLQNTLEALWVKTDDLERIMLSRNAAFIKEASRSSLNILDKLFGVKALSIRSVGSVVMLSIASAALAVLGVFVYIALMNHSVSLNRGDLSILGAATITSICSVLVAVLSFFRSTRVGRISFAVIVSISILAVACASLENGSDFLDVCIVGPCAIAVDLLFLKYLRWALRLTTQQSSVWSMTGILLSSLLVAALVNATFYPLFVNNVLDGAFGYSTSRLNSDLAGVLATNTLDALSALLVFGVIGTSLLHRLIWPFLKRPIYAAHRRELLKNTKVLCTLGFALLLYSVPVQMTRLTRFVDQVKLLTGGSEGSGEKEPGQSKPAAQHE